MTKYVLSTLGLALLWGLAFHGQAQAGEAACCGTASCEAGCNGGCNCGCDECCHYCPRCGCRLEPVCHPTCETKKETIHKYCCKCKDICIPGVTRIGERCGGCNECGGACGGGCATGCEACGPCNQGCDPGCQDSCDCRCRVHTVHKLMVCPATKEHCVRGCTVEWVCPQCSNCGSGCGATSAPTVAPAAPGPAAPAPAPNSNRLPPPPKTTGIALPEDIKTAQAGF